MAIVALPAASERGVQGVSPDFPTVVVLASYSKFELYCEETSGIKFSRPRGRAYILRLQGTKELNKRTHASRNIGLGTICT